MSHYEAGNHDPCPHCRRLHVWWEPTEGGAAYRRLRGNDIDRRHRCERGELWCGHGQPHFHRLEERWWISATFGEEPELRYAGVDACYFGLPDQRPGPTEVRPEGRRGLIVVRWERRGQASSVGGGR